MSVVISENTLVSFPKMLNNSFKFFKHICSISEMCVHVFFLMKLGEYDCVNESMMEEFFDRRELYF